MKEINKKGGNIMSNETNIYSIGGQPIYKHEKSKEFEFADAEPYAENTKLCCSMLTYPVMTDEWFQTLKIRDDKVINFYYVLPLYKEEMDYKLSKGMDALLDKFDKKKIKSVLDIKRKNAGKWF